MEKASINKKRITLIREGSVITIDGTKFRTPINISLDDSSCIISALRSITGMKLRGEMNDTEWDGVYRKVDLFNKHYQEELTKADAQQDGELIGMDNNGMAGEK